MSQWDKLYHNRLLRQEFEVMKLKVLIAEGYMKFFLSLEQVYVQHCHKVLVYQLFCKNIFARRMGAHERTFYTFCNDWPRYQNIKIYL